MKIDSREKDREDDVDELLLALLNLDNIIEIRAFMGDLLTKDELYDFANRWKVARMLKVGLSYKKIEKLTGVSSATIARMKKCMRDGEGGFDAMIKKMMRNHQ